MATMTVVISALPFTLSFSTMTTIFWLKMLVTMRNLPYLVLPVGIIPVIMDTFVGVLSYPIGNLLILQLHPRPIIIGRRIPGVATIQIVYIPGKEQIILNTDSYIETKLRRIQKEWRSGDNHRWVDINGRRTSNIHANVDANIGSMGK